MTPPNGPRGPGAIGVPSLGSESAAPEAASEGNAPRSPRQPMMAIFNPMARSGEIRHELPYFQRTMEREGYRVIPVETLPDLVARRERIFGDARALMEHVRDMGGQKIIFVPYGGDGILWESAAEIVRAAGIHLQPGQTDTLANQNLEKTLAIFIPRKGTAADNAVQTGSPSRIPAMARFLRGAVTLPFWFPTVEVHERPGEYHVAGHNFGLGESGHIFNRRAENFRAKPNSWLNRGIKSYLRLLPNAVFNRYGLLGFDVSLRHFGAEGNLLHEATLRGSEVIVSPNRIMGGVGGVPGAWGETKIVILPPGPRGVLALSEYIFRGIATKLGLNLVGPHNRLRTLTQDRQWRVREGERVDVEIRVPNNPGWDVLRALRPWNRTFWGLFDPLPAIPAAGEPLKIPAQLNGDVTASSSGFTVRSPGVAIPMLAHPNSLAVRLARSSALVNGGVPLLSDQQVTSFLPNHHPSVLEDTPSALRVRTPFVSQPRLMDTLARSRVPYQHGPQLLAAMQGINQPEKLNLLSDRGLTIERAREYLGSEAGQAWIREHRGEGRAFASRLLTGGVPLAAGIGTMIGGEYLADRLGLDPVNHRELRFGLVTYLSHAGMSNFSPLWEVAANRMLGRPYDFIRVRHARAAGEIFAQYTFESHSSFLRALGASWRSGTLGMEAGLEIALWRRGIRLMGTPFRAAWNMGEGLLFSRLTEHLVADLPADSALRRYGPTAAFFIPDVGRLMAPRSATRLFSARSMRFASRAFAAGFIGDMTYTGLHRLSFGGNATYEQSLNHRAAERRRERGAVGWFSWRAIPRLIAPSLADHFDSHHWLFGGETSERRELRAEDGRVGAAVQQSIRAELPAILQILGQTPEELLGAEIQLSFTEQDMLQQILACRGRGQLAEDADFQQTAAYLRRQFRAVVASEAEARRHLARIHAYQLQQEVAWLHGVDTLDNASIRGIFDERGRLRSGAAGDLARWVGVPLLVS